MRTATLTSAEIAAIAEQTRHGLLAAHDAEWINPDDGGSMASVVKGLELVRRGSGADETPQARERAQALGRRLESAAVRASLEDRSLGNLDSAPTLLALTGEYAGDGRKAGDRARHARTAEVDQAAPDDFRSTRSAEQVAAILRAQAERPGSRWSVGETVIAQKPGELARRLQENGIDLADDSPDRRKLDLAILRAKAAALLDIAERDRGGGGIATPARPEPINLPPAAQAETKTLSQMLDIWTKRKRPTRKTVDDARLYVGHFIAMHGDLEVGKVTRGLVRAYRDKLAEFPRALPNALIGKGADAIVAWAQANPEVAKLAPQTVNAKGMRYRTSPCRRSKSHSPPISRRMPRSRRRPNGTASTRSMSLQVLYWRSYQSPCAGCSKVWKCDVPHP